MYHFIVNIMSLKIGPSKSSEKCHKNKAELNLGHFRDVGIKTLLARIFTVACLNSYLIRGKVVQFVKKFIEVTI